jgi:hypothetical protein
LPPRKVKEEKKGGVLFCDTHTISSLLQLRRSAKDEFVRSLSVCKDDFVIAATSYDVNLNAEISGQLCEFLKGCFPLNCIVINGVVTHAVATNATREETIPELATHTSSFVFWLRLQLKIQEKGFSKESLQSLRDVHTPSDGGSLLSLSVCLHDNNLQSVCYGLRDHIVNGQFFGSEPLKVLRFFQTLIHGYDFLKFHRLIQPGLKLIDFIILHLIITVKYLDVVSFIKCGQFYLIVVRFQIKIRIKLKIININNTILIN